MKQSWRWFGPSDPISLAAVRQTGASGVVTALHEHPAGVAWPLDDIARQNDQIKAAGLTWDVCESIWMHDDIKLKGAGATDLVDSWKTSLINLAKCGIKTVCYNFMPVVDWTRTNLFHDLDGVGQALRFDAVDFAIYDALVLKRPGTADALSDDIRAEAELRFSQFTESDIDNLESNIIAGLPGGSDGFTRDSISARIAEFAELSPADLRGNLKSFLAEVVPVAEEHDVKLAIHPDDPPFSLFGLPRIVSTFDDLKFITEAVKSPSNGVTFCTGSLGARADNDLPKMAKALAQDIHFAHLRNTQRDPDGSFHEAEHLDGDTDMIAVLQVLMAESERRSSNGGDALVLRPDHGHLLEFEQGQKHNPGYSYLGRLKGLAELRGAICALQQIDRNKFTNN